MHPCAFCGGDCDCNGSIDDAVVDKTPVNCEGCGCEEMFEPDDDLPFYDDDEDDFEPVGWECLGCMKGFAHPGYCPICGNELEPYG